MRVEQARAGDEGGVARSSGSRPRPPHENPATPARGRDGREGREELGNTSLFGRRAWATAIPSQKRSILNAGADETTLGMGGLLPINSPQFRDQCPFAPGAGA